jgi:hypothetical protein
MVLKSGNRFSGKAMLKPRKQTGGGTKARAVPDVTPTT